MAPAAGKRRLRTKRYQRSALVNHGGTWCSNPELGYPIGGSGGLFHVTADLAPGGGVEFSDHAQVYNSGFRLSCGAC